MAAWDNYIKFYIIPASLPRLNMRRAHIHPIQEYEACGFGQRDQPYRTAEGCYTKKVLRFTCLGVRPAPKHMVHECQPRNFARFNIENSWVPQDMLEMAQYALWGRNQVDSCVDDDDRLLFLSSLFG